MRQKPHGNETWQDLPAPTGKAPYHLSLDSVLSGKGTSLGSASKTVFHTVGDTGNLQGSLEVQQAVADAMEADFQRTDKPLFFYHLGDVVYYWGQPDGYYPQFYEPYLHYPAPILAIPGNHDGGPPRPGDPPSLTAFVENFCANSPELSKEAHDAPRTAMTQPNVYWTLEAPFVTLIGLYSNVPEGGAFHDDQLSWFVDELKNAPQKKALIVSVHHPVYSLDRWHRGSTQLEETLDGCYKKAARRADMILTGHVHNFQRYTEVVDKEQVPHIVAGAGGYANLHQMQKMPDGSAIEVPFKLQDADDVTLENYCDNRHGFMRIEVDDKTITGEYYAVDSTPAGGGQAQRIDSFQLDYRNHTVNKSTRPP